MSNIKKREKWRKMKIIQEKYMEIHILCNINQGNI